MPLILGLESSCDDSAAALVSGDRQILAQAVVGQNEAHRPFGGVVPEIAARAHVDILPGLIRQVLAEADVAIGEVDAIAATAGPGLIGGVMVALLAGKGLAIATGKPLIAINHLEGHALSPRLVDRGLDFPYLLLLASGGHCQLLEVRGVGDYRRLDGDNSRVFAHIRTWEEDILVCVHNLARSAQAVELDLSRWEGFVPEEMFGRTRFPRIGELPYLLTLAPRGFFWFQLRKDDSE